MGKRKDIKNAIVTELQNISTGSGYNNDIGSDQVFRNYKRIEDIRKFPALVIVGGDVLFTPKTNKRYTTGGGIDSLTGWRIGILCYDQVDSDTEDSSTLDDAMEDIVEDVIEVITQNPRFGLSYVHNTYLKEVAISNDYVSENLGIAYVIYEVKYDFPVTAA